MSTLAEQIMVPYQNEAHLVHEFFSDIFPCMNFFWVPPPPITFLMVRPSHSRRLHHSETRKLKLTVITNWASGSNYVDVLLLDCEQALVFFARVSWWSHNLWEGERSKPERRIPFFLAAGEAANRTTTERDRFSVKAELFREISGRLFHNLNSCSTKIVYSVQCKISVYFVKLFQYFTTSNDFLKQL